MMILKHWATLLILGLVCNGLGIFLHRRGAENPAIALVVLGIVNVAASMWVHHKSTKSQG
ncbi:MAG: hypothetical protein QNL51_02110 [Opitutaceae bacterium]|tara:strand:+ start:10345 stop:10524 length:180 start_codon:yes stop_codon:yes gene_type:complete